MTRASLAFLLLLVSSMGHAQVTGSVPISWTAPTQNTDGSALTNLAGFVLSYGSTPAAADYRISITNAATRSYTVTGLTPSAWYFTVQSVRADNITSLPSNAVSATVAAPPPPPPLTVVGPYSYEASGTAIAPTMSAIGLVLPGLPCGSVVRVVGTTTFCQIQRSQTDLIGWPKDKTLTDGVWAKAAP